MKKCVRFFRNQQHQSSIHLHDELVEFDSLVVPQRNPFVLRQWASPSNSIDFVLDTRPKLALSSFAVAPSNSWRRRSDLCTTPSWSCDERWRTTRSSQAEAPSKWKSPSISATSPEPSTARNSFSSQPWPKPSKSFPGMCGLLNLRSNFSLNNCRFGPYDVYNVYDYVVFFLGNSATMPVLIPRMFSTNSDTGRYCR